mmetsp:Transcript_24334/g.58739  ORF Transcript_24334/g.58739 Transcript_24334/m.58739 type:complete len:253 (-) Transcript_24334:157-915(-)
MSKYSPTNRAASSAAAPYWPRGFTRSLALPCSSLRGGENRRRIRSAPRRRKRRRALSRQASIDRANLLAGNTPATSQSPPGQSVRYVGSRQRMAAAIERIQNRCVDTEDEEEEESLCGNDSVNGQHNDGESVSLLIRSDEANVAPQPPPQQINEYRLVYRQRRRSPGCPKKILDVLPTSTGKNAGGNVQCMICIMTVKGRELVRILPCLHKFHKRCIDTWLKGSLECPVCKMNVPRAILNQEMKVANLLQSG